MAKRKTDVTEKLKVIPKTKPETGIDVNKTITDNIITAAQVGSLDVGAINSLSSSAQTREQLYEIYDNMAQDDVISAVLETYAEDTIQTNDKGQSIWVESSDADALSYATWVIDSLNIDKHLYQWVYCLITNGDLYVRLFRKSDTQEDVLFRNNIHNKKLNESRDSKEPLKEDVKLRVYADNDHYIPYVQMVDNPCEIFDLQKFGKTYGFIKTPVRVLQQINNDEWSKYLTKYTMKQSDVEIFDAMSFVHGCLENTNQRQPETVDLYLDDLNESGESNYDAKDSMTTSYSVKRGQSLLFNSFKIWRELNLLEMSALLNRLTKSAIVRILNIDVGDMPKEQVKNFINRLKEKIEQKSAINTGENGAMAQYTNPGPIDNTIYVPTHGTQGNITATAIGGDFDPKSLVDLEYFRDKLFGSLKVPKQFFGFTEDGAGFNGGTSLTILSARYANSIKKIQGIICQLVTDIVNLFLIDRGLDNYVNRFQIRMQTPTTQAEIDRRTNTDNRVRFVSDVMQQLGDIKDETIKLKIQKALLTGVVNDSEVISYLDNYIDDLEKEKLAKDKSKRGNDEEAANPDEMGGLVPDESEAAPEETAELPSAEEIPLESLEDDEKQTLVEDDTDDDFLPSPDALGLDLTDKK